MWQQYMQVRNAAETRLVSQPLEPLWALSLWDSPKPTSNGGPHSQLSLLTYHLDIQGKQ